MEAVFLKLLNMSIAAGWLILAVLFLRVLLKKAPKALHCVLWGLVAVRLLCPFSFESALRLIPSAETVPREILYARSPEIHSGIPAINSAVNPVISEAFAPEAAASVNPMQIIVFAASHIWAIGVAALLLYAVAGYLRIRGKVVAAVRLQDNIWQSEQVDSPFILGMIQPRIYLPFSMEAKQQEYVVAHERAHLQRRDHWWKPLGFALLAVYWFNPLVWAAYALLCRDIELACDEKVIKDMGVPDKKAYSEALLSCSLPRSMIAACPLAFGEVGVKERIKSVFTYKKPAFWVVAAAVAASVVLAVCFLTNPPGISIYDIIEEKGYAMIKEEQRVIPLSIPKDALPESTCTEEGHTFGENEVIVYQSDGIVIDLDEVRISNESDDLLYFTFGYSLHLPESGTALIPYSSVIDGSAMPWPWNNELNSDSGTYADAVHGCGQHEGAFVFYVSADACKKAAGTMELQAVCCELTYVREGMEAESSIGKRDALENMGEISALPICFPRASPGHVLHLPVQRPLQ